ncbi:MAG: hypothetical protein CVU70_01350, partial [Deltaproteobacteria bacterium HGW-Deltaproteobacteria-5]
MQGMPATLKSGNFGIGYLRLHVVIIFCRIIIAFGSINQKAGNRNVFQNRPVILHRHGDPESGDDRCVVLFCFLVKPA